MPENSIKEIICTSCPIGCRLKVDVKNRKVSGNSCKRGELYGLSEATNPVRLVTSVVKVKNGKEKLVPVKTSLPIKKDLNFECIKIIKNTVVSAPIKLGDVIVKNILNTGANLVATKNIESVQIKDEEENR